MGCGSSSLSRRIAEEEVEAAVARFPSEEVEGGEERLGMGPPADKQFTNIRQSSALQSPQIRSDQTSDTITCSQYIIKKYKYVATFRLNNLRPDHRSGALNSESGHLTGRLVGPGPSRSGR